MQTDVPWREVTEEPVELGKILQLLTLENAEDQVGERRGVRYCMLVYRHGLC